MLRKFVITSIIGFNNTHDKFLHRRNTFNSVRRFDERIAEFPRFFNLTDLHNILFHIRKGFRSVVPQAGLEPARPITGIPGFSYHFGFRRPFLVRGLDYIFTVAFALGAQVSSLYGARSFERSHGVAILKGSPLSLSPLARFP